MLVTSRKLIAVLVLAVLLGQSCNAATIEVTSQGPGKPSVVTINGPLVASDYQQFLRKIISVTEAIVSLNSDGGILLAGLQIGETIRLRNFTTLVPENGRCASSCALAWLGGTKRLMASNAQIGFHAASNGLTHEVTSSGNALIGAYLNKLGLLEKAVVYITDPSPQSIRWLSLADAQAVGVDVSRSAEVVVPTRAVIRTEPQHSANGDLVLPNAILSQFASDDPGRARMHTCLEQYKANKETNSNGGHKWIEAGGGYYTMCNNHLKGQ
jgi:hypothetical protein